MTDRSDFLPPGDTMLHVVRTIIDIATPPERLFEALTDPRELAEWWSDGAPVGACESDARPGGAWRIVTVTDDGGGEHAVGGEYRVIDAPRRLESTWWTSEDEGESLVRYDLEPMEVNGAPGTRLTVTHTGPVALAMSVHPARWMSLVAPLARRCGAGRASTLVLW